MGSPNQIVTSLGLGHPATDITGQSPETRQFIPVLSTRRIRSIQEPVILAGAAASNGNQLHERTSVQGALTREPQWRQRQVSIATHGTADPQKIGVVEMS